MPRRLKSETLKFTIKQDDTNFHREETTKRTLRALALRQSERRRVHVLAKY